MSLEELVRTILAAAINQGLVEPGETPPEDMTAGDVSGLAEIIDDYLEERLK